MPPDAEIEVAIRVAMYETPSPDEIGMEDRAAYAKMHVNPPATIGNGDPQRSG
jgi:hypothetical protein